MEAGALEVEYQIFIIFPIILKVLGKFAHRVFPTFLDFTEQSWSPKIDFFSAQIFFFLYRAQLLYKLYSMIYQWTRLVETNRMSYRTSESDVSPVS